MTLFRTGGEPPPGACRGSLGAVAALTAAARIKGFASSFDDKRRTLSRCAAAVIYSS